MDGMGYRRGGTVEDTILPGSVNDPYAKHPRLLNIIYKALCGFKIKGNSTLAADDVATTICDVGCHDPRQGIYEMNPDLV